MLDENLPTFYFRPSSDNPNASILYFTQNGSEPSPQYLFRRADPASQPAARNRYAAALGDPYSTDVVFAEVLVDPTWTQPTLSAAELRQNGGVTPPPAPQVPDSFVVQLYEPETQVTLKQIPGGFASKDSYEFEMPVTSFRLPSASAIDRQQSDPASSDVLAPRVAFRWRRDGMLSKDMTCYMVGRTVQGRRSKEPDITIALYKYGTRETSVTIYEPNLRRVDVEDRKGLEVVILLGAEVVKELFLAPGKDTFNLSPGSTPGAAGAAAATAGAAITGTAAAAVATSSAGRRRGSRPSPVAGPTLSLDPPTSHIPPSQIPPPKKPQRNPPTTAAAAVPSSSTTAPPAPGGSSARPPPTDPRTQWEIDAETKRLQTLVGKEEKERERLERAEQKRIKRMLEDEEKERRRRESEIAKETERLRKKYGTQGQDLPSDRPSLPPRPGHQPPPVPSSSSRPQHHQLPGGSSSGWPAAAPPPAPVMTSALTPPPPPRPSSAGPFGASHPTLNSWWRGPAAAPVQPPPPQQPPRPQGYGAAGPYPFSSYQAYMNQQGPPPPPPQGQLHPGPYGGGAAHGASSSGFFGRRGGSPPNATAEERRQRMQKKRSVHF